MKKLLIFCVAISMATAFTAPAFAAEWAFYGISKMQTFWNDASRETTTAGLFDDEDITWAQQGNSRIGANIKVSDTITARFEYGTGVNLRHLYGEWGFGVGKLLIGHTYVPVNVDPSGQVWAEETGLCGFGAVDDTREDMIRFRFGNFDVAFVEPSHPGGVLPAATAASFSTVATTATLAAGQVRTATVVGPDTLTYTPASGFGTETDTSIPKIQVQYNNTISGLFFQVGGGYNTYDEVVTATDREYDIDSWMLFLGLEYSIGPIKLTGSIFAGENVEDFGQTVAEAGDARPVYNAALDRIDDNESWGGQLIVGFAVNDLLSFEAGGGFQGNEVDDNDVATGENDASSIYVQAVITPAQGVTIVPELGYVGFEENGFLADDGDITYFGAMWQIAW
jgi:hypothetical protein